MVRFFYVQYTKNVRFLSGRKDPHGPDLPSPFGRRFQFSVQFSSAMSEKCCKTPPTVFLKRKYLMLNWFSLPNFQIKRLWTIYCNYLLRSVVHLAI